MDDLDGSEPEPTAGRPDTVEGWRTAASAMLSPPCCAFHRNVEISARYAWLHQQLPGCFTWAAMAAIASHHIRRVLFPLRLDTDRGGHLDLARSLSRRGLLTEDANIIREINSAIFGDIFWVHLAYLADAEDGTKALDRLLAPIPHYAAVLLAFAAIERGRRALAEPDLSPEERRDAVDGIWAGNVALLEHEQRALVQPHFDRLSPTFARLVSLGAVTAFDVRGVRHEVRYFTSFSLFSLGGGLAGAVRGGPWPRITRFEDRWRWLEHSVVPRFRRLDAQPHLVRASLDRVIADAQHYAGRPCVLPR